ncbi:cupin domain-containing protein [Streptomyces sp. NPDC004629]|uniref:cupin domain-containing protein n=1 Tax=Streptomyces sp. NPDC004629 TaxID=3364705 RepID=UPI00368142BA
MRYVRSFADHPTDPAVHQPEFLAHLESCSVIKGGIPAGTQADPLHYHPVDQFYYVLEGTIEVQLGTERLRAEPHTLVRIPARTPHFAANPGTDHVLQVELLLPTHVPATGGRMTKLVEYCDDLGGPPPTGCLRPVATDGWLRPLPEVGVEMQVLANRATGSDKGMVAVSRTEVDATVPPYHSHEFDELIFVLAGTLAVDIGSERRKVRPHELVIMPARVPHRAWNEGPEPEQHLTIITPEPDSQNPADWLTEVDFSARR